MPKCQRRPELEDIGCIQGKITAKPFILWKNDSKTISVPWILCKSIRFPVDSLSRTNPKFCHRALTGRHLREKLQRVGAVVLRNEPQQGRRSLGETSFRVSHFKGNLKETMHIQYNTNFSWYLTLSGLQLCLQFSKPIQRWIEIIHSKHASFSPFKHRYEPIFWTKFGLQQQHA